MVRIRDNFLTVSVRSDKIHNHKDNGRFSRTSFVPIHILFMDFHTLDEQKK